MWHRSFKGLCKSCKKWLLTPRGHEWLCAVWDHWWDFYEYIGEILTKIEHILNHYSVGWSDFFFIGQKMVLNQRSGIIPSPILNFRWRSARAAKFSFSKIPGGLNINIFLWKFAWCFLLHKRTNPEKQIWNLSFKTTILDPEKACFCFFKKIPKLFFFFVFWLWLSFKNNRCTIDFLVSIFKISLQKSY